MVMAFKTAYFSLHLKKKAKITFKLLTILTLEQILVFVLRYALFIFALALNILFCLYS